LSVITSLSVVLQIATPTFLISFIVGGWAFWVLRKPEVKAAFADELRRRTREPERRSQHAGEVKTDVQQGPLALPPQPALPADGLEGARRRVAGAAAGLIVTAFFNWTGLLLIAILVGQVLVNDAVRGRWAVGRAEYPQSLDDYVNVAGDLSIYVLPAFPIFLAPGVLLLGGL